MDNYWSCSNKDLKVWFRGSENFSKAKHLRYHSSASHVLATDRRKPIHNTVHCEYAKRYNNHMISFHPLRIKFFQTQKSKIPTISTCYHFTTNLSLHFHAQTNNAPYSSLYTLIYSDQNLLQTVATHLSNSTSLLLLNQIHAQIITSQVLHFCPTAFLWNNIIRSYVRLDNPSLALRVYAFMSRSNIYPDVYTIPIVLKAVCQSFAFEVGRQVHTNSLKHGLVSHEFCESGFISVYVKSGEFENARKLFEESVKRKLGSWNAIIGGLAHGGRYKEAVTMFMELLRYGLQPDDVTMVSVTSACGSLGDLNLARQLHKCVFQAKRFDKSDLLMFNSLIDMYGKCGRMELAYKVFGRMMFKNVSTWTSLIMGYAMHGHVKDALECFRCMREAGVVPNHVTFVGVLSACVHGGMVEEGRYYFNMMKKTYRIAPMLPHFGLMVDLFGRAGLLEEAREMVEAMPMNANVIIWGTLMGACEKHGNVEMGEWVARHLEELEPWSDGHYVVLSNIYAAAEMWEKVEKVREMMKDKNVGRNPGYSLATSSG